MMVSVIFQDPNETYPCDPDIDDIMGLKTEEEKRVTIKVCAILHSLLF